MTYLYFTHHNVWRCSPILARLFAFERGAKVHLIVLSKILDSTFATQVTYLIPLDDPATKSCDKTSSTIKDIQS